MGRPGNCHNNAQVESFFSTLKNELVRDGQFQTRVEAHTAIFEYIELFYNPRPLYQALGYQSSQEYKQERTDP